ncbi:MAG: hypothetical protein GY906_33630 [bacterium]|nr:hypothetical protein [bacterium]
MAEYLNINTLIEFNPAIAEMEDGEQLSMRHPECPAGDDGRKVLFVKKHGAKHLAFCHHCGQKGILTGDQSFIRRGGQNLLIEKDLHLPPDLTFEPTKQPVEHIMWLHQHGIDDMTRRLYDIGWSEHWGRTILPVYGDEGKLLAFQRRNVLRGDFGPKYLTTRLAHIKNPVFRAPRSELAERKPGILVLTEDILSSIKIDKAGFYSWSLLGTYMTNSVVDEIAAAQFDQVIIWLDDDNEAVRRSQKVMRRKISQIADARIMRHRDLSIRKEDKSDPKMFTPNEIHTAIRSRLA